MTAEQLSILYLLFFTLLISSPRSKTHRPPWGSTQWWKPSGKQTLKPRRGIKAPRRRRRTRKNPGFQGRKAQSLWESEMNAASRTDCLRPGSNHQRFGGLAFGWQEPPGGRWTQQMWNACIRSFATIVPLSIMMKLKDVYMRDLWQLEPLRWDTLLKMGNYTFWTLAKTDFKAKRAFPVCLRPHSGIKCSEEARDVFVLS